MSFVWCPASGCLLELRLQPFGLGEDGGVLKFTSEHFLSLVSQLDSNKRTCCFSEVSLFLVLVELVVLIRRIVFIVT